MAPRDSMNSWKKSMALLFSRKNVRGMSSCSALGSYTPYVVACRSPIARQMFLISPYDPIESVNNALKLSNRKPVSSLWRFSHSRCQYGNDELTRLTTALITRPLRREYSPHAACFWKMIQDSL